MLFQPHSEVGAYRAWRPRRKDRKSALPIPDINTVFEVVSDGRVYRVTGVNLRDWIRTRRKELKGPAGYLFNKRPALD